MKKNILGLDLGTNSIGWALVSQDDSKGENKILGTGSRIIPMSQDVLGKFDGGISISQTAERTGFRGMRRLYQRDNLRRERLHRVLNILGFLPEHYQKEIDFDTHLGQFINGAEPKIAYSKGENGKHEFIFLEPFLEMVEEFKKIHPNLFLKKNNGTERKIPHDWTIYFLRKKALTEKISKFELAWLLLHFNQKRGYYQLSEQNEDNSNQILEEYHSLKVVEVVDTGERKKTGEIWYNVILENGWIYHRANKVPIFEWKGSTKEFIVSTKLNGNGTIKTNKNGEPERSFRAPQPDDWGLKKRKTEFDIEKSKKSVGTYIYDELLKDPNIKIRGKFIRTIERKYYKEELEKILIKQIELHPELRNSELYSNCTVELYPNNISHRKNIENRNFKYLFLEDIIFYQRPLKTKKYLISDCPLENRIQKDTGKKTPIKCIGKSNPLYQEFRLWQFVGNLRIFQRQKIENGETKFNLNVTHEYLKEESNYTDLYNWLNNREEAIKKVAINQKQLLAYFKLKEEEFCWNYVEEKEFPLNETRGIFLKRIKKIEGINASFFTQEKTTSLWHILYSITDPNERKKALITFSKKNELPDEFAESFVKLPPFKKDYGAYSEKAIKKLLALMRMGDYWNWDGVALDTKSRITKLMDGEWAPKIREKVREKVIHLNTESDYKGLPLWLASYIVYDRHAEANDIRKWNSPHDIKNYLLNEFKQHSLRNPIVEQIICETLRVVTDIWEEFGSGKKDFFDEIHLELGREMKNPAEKRKYITNQNLQNENTNLRIRGILTELQKELQNIKPYSPPQQEILKIYEEGVYQNETRKDILEEIDKIRKNQNPTKLEFQRYKLWLEQGYISPYTGKIISLTDLFSTKYQIEHIFPQSRFFDDSLNNKVICESAVNQLKDNKTAFEFIQSNGGETVPIENGKTVKIFKTSEYELHVKKYFSKNKIKMENLLNLDIPDSFINRQMNDSRYISKVVKNLLSNIVRDEDEQEVTSKKLLPITGTITSKMKQDWGLNDVWNEIITPRFLRMNEITKSKDFGEINPKTRKFLPKVPDSIQRGFNKKRIDHRHHALDAIVLACISRNHINFLNNLNAKETNEKEIKYQLRNTLCYKSEIDANGNYKWIYKKPWETFTQDVRKNLEKTISSFKQNNRVINKTKNKYQKFELKDGILTKQLVLQTKGENWAVRKSLHKATYYGEVKLFRAGKYLRATAGRVELSDKFSAKQLEKVTDTGIQLILNNHIKNYLDPKGEPQFHLAFGPEGLESMNKNIFKLNNNKEHKPIYSVRLYEEGNKFSLGSSGTKNKKFVEADKGTNLFFAVYWNEKKKKREFETIPLNAVIEHLKQNAQFPKTLRTPVPVSITKGNLLFVISPNDVVYVPSLEEQNDPQLVNFSELNPEQSNRVYKFISSSGNQAFFIQSNVASKLQDKFEFSALNKMEKDMLGNMVKEICWKMNINRIGKVLNVVR